MLKSIEQAIQYSEPMTISEAPKEQEPPQDLRPAFRILVIDDSPACRRMMQRQIESHGFAVTTAPDGCEGLRLAATMRPSIILLDLNLPDMSGFQVLQRLHGDDATKDIPVLCVTGMTDVGGLLRDAAGGLKACGYLSKPFTGDQLLTEIRFGLTNSAAKGCVPQGNRRLPNPYQRGPIEADTRRRTIHVRGADLPDLPARCFDLLYELMRHSGPVSRMELLREVWPGHDNANVVDVTVLRLRKVLDGVGGVRIETTRGGYELICD